MALNWQIDAIETRLQAIETLVHGHLAYRSSAKILLPSLYQQLAVASIPRRLIISPIAILTVARPIGEVFPGGREDSCRVLYAVR